MKFINTNNRKRIISTAALIVILISIMTFSLYFYLLPGIATLLSVQTNLQQSDVIIILGGDSERVSYGVELYRENYSDNIIVTGGPVNIPYVNTTLAELQKKEAIELGVLPEDIFLADTSTTTYEDALFARDIMLQNNFTSAIVVSSPYHMRRAAWLFGKVFKNDDITLLYSPVENSWFKPEQWWTDGRKIHAVMDEYAKFVYYLFK
jgi:uncharacterized SAM-binding protein YcdF (DUF218 family)